jgi:hypothetical protein
VGAVLVYVQEVSVEWIAVLKAQDDGRSEKWILSGCASS